MPTKKITIKANGTTKKSRKNKKRRRAKSRKSSSKSGFFSKGWKSYVKSAVILLAVIGVGVAAYLGIRSYKSLEETGFKPSIGSTLGGINEKPELKKDDNGYTNALVTGIDTRPSNQGLQNTDSIIFITVNHETNEAAMLSLPRDLWVEHPNYPGYFTKINAIYNSCEQEKEGTGMECLCDVVETITGREIQYHMMIDIKGMIKIVDIIGGIDVEVENSFTDYMFPDGNWGYKVVSFEEGTQHMDGETAMEFARSRHAQSVEGSDFARARRQQRVIIAVKQKVLSTETFTDLSKVSDIIKELGNNIKISEYTPEDIRAAYNLAEEIEKDNIHSMVLDPMAGNWSLLAEDPSSAYALYPKAGEGNWTEVNKFLNAYFENPQLYTENATIYVYNGGLGYYETYDKAQELIAAYPHLNITYGGNAAGNITIEGNKVKNVSEQKFDATVEEFKSYLELEESMAEETDSEDSDNSEDQEESQDVGITAIYGEDIVIIFGTPQTSEQTETE